MACKRAEIQLPGCGNLIVHPPQFLTFAALRKGETEQHFHNQLNYSYGNS